MLQANYNFFTQEGHSAFARLWGELYTGEKDLALLTHQQIAGAAIYAGLVKQVVLGADGVLRAQWWANNDVLKAGPLTMSAAAAPAAVGGGSGGGGGGSGGKQTSTVVTECVGSCLSSGLWLEGTITPGSGPAVGIWVGLNGTAADGFSFLIDSSGNFTLGPMEHNGRGVAAQRPPKGQGSVVIDRALKLVPGKAATFRLLLRNAWSSLGMSEVRGFCDQS